MDSILELADQAEIATLIGCIFLGKWRAVTKGNGIGMGRESKQKHRKYRKHEKPLEQEHPGNWIRSKAGRP